MTDFNICCLCASDEGVFLDIFASTGHQLGNRCLLKEFETCLSFKVKKSGNLSSKICHKCAIELGECNRFIEKYQQASTDIKKKASKSAAKRSCCLCFTTAKNRYLFTLAKDFKSTIDSLQKLYECLQLQITREEAEGKLICLFCRYNLDVLYDLKKLAREVSPKLQIITKTKAIVDNLPKTETFVVSRKTTVTRQTRIKLATPFQSDSEHDTMARRQLRTRKLANVSSGVEVKPRICGQCDTLITGGVDMYRLHKTGVTVCKMCWITMDPLKATKDNKRKEKNQAESKSTKLCAVFLKDVLSPTSSKELPVQQVHKVEKVTEDEVIYITSDDSLTDEEQSNNRTRRNSSRRWGGKAAKSDQEFDRKLRPGGMKRSLKEEDAESNDKSMKKLKSMKKIPVNSSSELRRSNRSHNSDSEIVIARKKQRTNSAVEEPQRLQKSNNIRSGNKLGKRKMDRKVPKAKEDVKLKIEDLSASDDDVVVRKLRKVRAEVPSASKSESPDSSQVEKSRKNVKSTKASIDSKPDSNSPVQKKLKAQSVVTKSPSTKVKVPPKRSKTVMMVSFPFKLKDPYECKVCGTIYRNKVVGMKHELTHFKQVEIKLEKLNIPHHFQTVNETSATKEIPEESPNDSCSLDSSQTNENLSQSEITASVDKEDDDNRINDKTPAKERVPSTDEPEFSQQNDKSSDVGDDKEPDAVISTEQPIAEESTSATKDSNESKKEETTEKEVSELGHENEESTKDDDTSNNDATKKQPEADLSTESTVDDVHDTTEKDASETVKEDAAKESVKELEESVADAEDKICEEKKNDKDVVHTVVSLNTENKDEPGNEDLVDDVESDVDIRIVDTGSSAEESSEQVKKEEEKNAEKKEEINAGNASDSSISEDVTDTKEASIEPTDAKENISTSEDESQTIIASNTEPEKEPVKGNQPAEPSPKNEEQTPEEVESPTSDKIDGAPSETVNETNGGAEAIENSSTVSEILQEVIDLASAEVKKRAEKEETAAETLEDISNEINKTSTEISGSIEAKTNERTDYGEAETKKTLNDLN